MQKFLLMSASILKMSQLLNHGEPVSIWYDPTSPVSFLSASTVGCLKLSTSQGCYSGTLLVPTLPSQKLPSRFTSICKIFIGHNLNHDIVLGMNWIGLCHVVMVDGLVEFHPSSSECNQPLVHFNLCKCKSEV